MTVTWSGIIHAQSDTLEERVSRLERTINSETLVELLQQVERLQQEVQELRGEIEVQAHELSQLKLRQRELYLDIDRRMSNLETSRPAATTDSGTATAGGDGGSETAAETGGTVTADVDPGEEREAYQSAFDLLKSGRYEDAAKEFTGFLAAYPTGEYTDKAQYWLGEAYYVTRAFEPALEEFHKLVQTHPDSARSVTLVEDWLHPGRAGRQRGSGEITKRAYRALSEHYRGAPCDGTSAPDSVTLRYKHGRTPSMERVSGPAIHGWALAGFQ